MSFLNEFEQHSWQQMGDRINQKTEADVEQAISRNGKRNLDDFCALVSPAAAPYLEQMAQLSYQLTRKRFGNTTQLYIPLYLSNECHNICTYCGFSVHNKIERLTLDKDQLMEEVEQIKGLGFDHILLVTGEANRKSVWNILNRYWTGCGPISPVSVLKCRHWSNRTTSA